MELDEAALYARAQIEEVQHRRSAVKDRPGGLSRRELEVLHLVTDGLTTREIAARLFISAKTADRHIQNIYTKDRDVDPGDGNAMGTGQRSTGGHRPVAPVNRLGHGRRVATA